MRTQPDFRSLHGRALEDAGGLIAGVTPADLARPTPCAGWDLGTLLGHMIGQNLGFAAAAAAGDAPAAAYQHVRFSPDELPTIWQRSADAVTASFRAAPLDRSVTLVEFAAGNPFPIAVVVGFHLLDTVVHAWDVASSLGIDFRPDDKLVAATLGVAERVPQTLAVRQDPASAFDPVLPDDGTDGWVRALALLGRSAAEWSAERG